MSLSGDIDFAEKVFKGGVLCVYVFARIVLVQLSGVSIDCEHDTYQRVSLKEAPAPILPRLEATLDFSMDPIRGLPDRLSHPL